jgi:hypothetical protein
MAAADTASAAHHVKLGTAYFATLDVIEAITFEAIAN